MRGEKNSTGQLPGIVLAVRSIDRLADGGRRQSEITTTENWQRLTCTWTPGRSIHTAAVLIGITSVGRVWFDDLSVRIEDYGGYEDEPGLVLAEGGIRIEARLPIDTPVLLRPLPLAHDGQAPINFELTTTPQDALKTVSVEMIGGNPVARLTFRPLAKGDRVDVRWQSLVLAGPPRTPGPPAVAPKPAEWPEEARPWLQSTWTVGSAEPAFQKEAEALTQGTDDVREIIRRALIRAEVIQQTQRPWTRADQNTHVKRGLTATNALTFTGSCTSAANLFAALMRASGVPARFVAGYPTWSGPLQTHAVVEVWIPTWGWYPVESTMLKENAPPYGQIQVSAVPTEHETQALSDSRGSIISGVPYLSLVESEQTYDQIKPTGLISEVMNCDHQAYHLKNFSADLPPETWQTVLAAGQARWTRWLDGQVAKGASAEPLVTPWPRPAVLAAAQDETLGDMLSLLVAPKK